MSEMAHESHKSWGLGACVDSHQKPPTPLELTLWQSGKGNLQRLQNNRVGSGYWDNNLIHQLENTTGLLWTISNNWTTIVNFHHDLYFPVWVSFSLQVLSLWQRHQPSGCDVLTFYLLPDRSEANIQQQSSHVQGIGIIGIQYDPMGLGRNSCEGSPPGKSLFSTSLGRSTVFRNCEIHQTWLLLTPMRCFLHFLLPDLSMGLARCLEDTTGIILTEVVCFVFWLKSRKDNPVFTTMGQMMADDIKSTSLPISLKAEFDQIRRRQSSEVFFQRYASKPVRKVAVFPAKNQPSHISRGFPAFAGDRRYWHHFFHRAGTADARESLGLWWSEMHREHDEHGPVNPKEKTFWQLKLQIIFIIAWLDH